MAFKDVKPIKECDILDIDGDISYHLERLMKGLIVKTYNETNAAVVSRLERIELMMAKMQQQNQEMMAKMQQQNQEMVKMQLQNQEIIDLMSENKPGQTPVKLPDSPLSSEEELGILEYKLKDGAVFDRMVRKLQTVEVDDAKKYTKAILSRLMTKDLASKYTWMGTVDKKPFKDLLVNKLVQEAVRRNPNHSETTNELIKEYTTQWLNGSRGKGTKKPKPSPPTNTPTTEIPPTNTNIYINTSIIDK